MRELIIIPAPWNANQRRRKHWSKISAEAKRVKRDVMIQSRGWSRPAAGPVRVHVHRIAWNRMDPTGVIESLKPVLDGLVAAGWIPDDSERWIQGVTVSQEIRRVVWFGRGYSELRVSLEEGR